MSPLSASALACNPITESQNVGLPRRTPDTAGLQASVELGFGADLRTEALNWISALWVPAHVAVGRGADELQAV